MHSSLTCLVLLAFTVLAVSAQGEAPHLPFEDSWTSASATAAKDAVTITGCGHTNLPLPDVGCPNHCEEVTIPADFYSQFMKASGWKYPGYTKGTCSAHFNAVEAKWVDYDFPKSGVTHVKKGYAPPDMVEATKSLTVHDIADSGNHCYQLSVSADSPCFQAFWLKQGHQYDGWAQGACPAKFSFVNKRDSSVCPDGSVVTEYLGLPGGIKELLSRIKSSADVSPALLKHFVHPTEPHCEDVAVQDKSSTFWKAFSWRYDSWKSGQCPAKYNLVNNRDSPARGVVHRTMGIKTDPPGLQVAPLSSGDDWVDCRYDAGGAGPHTGTTRMVFTNKADSKVKISSHFDRMDDAKQAVCGNSQLAPGASMKVLIDYQYWFLFTFNGEHESELWTSNPFGIRGWPGLDEDGVYHYDIHKTGASTSLAATNPSMAAVQRHLKNSPDTHHCEEIEVANKDEPYWVNFGWRYESWGSGTCPSMYNFVNKKKSLATGVKHTVLGIKQAV